MQPRVRLVLVGTEGEINLGFIARLAANFSVDEIYLVNPLVDPASEEVRRFAAHGAYMVDRFHVVDSLDAALEGVELAACTSARVGQRSDVLRHPVTAREFAEKIAPRYQSLAVVFGRESVGLTREEISKCHLLVTIPANPEYPVLNLSHAVAIILYELWLIRSQARGHVRLEEAKPENLEHTYRLLERLVEKTVDAERAPQVKAALRHILWKCPLTAGEVSALYLLAKKLARLVETRQDGEEHTR
jgi:TrmH family RNA methyltransferase